MTIPDYCQVPVWRPRKNDFYSNINTEVDYPRRSQAAERRMDLKKKF